MGWARDRAGSIIDVGGGASTLAGDLLALGYSDLTVLDISEQGLAIARGRLQGRASDVVWMVADIRSWPSSRRFAVWHDRAVLHFMTEPAALADYRTALLAATEPGSLAVVGVFGPDGPTSCSGHSVRRWTPAEIRDFLAPDFDVEHSQRHGHVTPREPSSSSCGRWPGVIEAIPSLEPLRGRVC